MPARVLVLPLLAITFATSDVWAQVDFSRKDAAIQRLEVLADVPPLTAEPGKVRAELVSYPVNGGESLIIRIERQGEIAIAHYWPIHFRWMDGFRDMNLQRPAAPARMMTLSTRQFDSLLSEANGLVIAPPVRPAPNAKQPPCIDGSVVRVRLAEENGIRVAYPYRCDLRRTGRFVDRMRLAVGRMSPAAFSDQYGPQ